MKFVSKFLNLLLFIFTFCLMTVAQWGVYDLLALPTGMDNTIGFISTDKDKDGIADNVAYLDTYTFIGEDIVQSVTREPRYLVRSWFEWDWWQNGMKWADYAVEFVVGATVPIFAPMYEVGQIDYFYADQYTLALDNNDARVDLNWFAEKPLTVYGTYDITQNIEIGKAFEDVIDAYEAKTGKNDFFYMNKLTVEKATEDDYLSDDPKAKLNTAFQKLFLKHRLTYKNAFIFMPGDLPCSGKIYKIDETSLTKIAECTGIINDGTGSSSTVKVGSSWFHDNSGFMNTIYKINKYNERKPAKVMINGEAREMNFSPYDNWYNKFTSHGNIKSSVISLYFQFFMALIGSIWFVCQNPLKINRSEYGENEISGGYRTRKNKKKNRKKE